jgi:hypothetical protein
MTQNEIQTALVLSVSWRLASNACRTAFINYMWPLKFGMDETMDAWLAFEHGYLAAIEEVTVR